MANSKITQSSQGWPLWLVRLLGVAGPLLAWAAWEWLPTPWPADARLVAALSVWMGLWWLGQPLPMAVTALLPLLVLPSVSGLSAQALTGGYGHPILYLFLGGFLLARALQKWGLSERLALSLVGRAGRTPARVIGAFMLATALLSMWISNTASVIVMLALAQPLAQTLGQEGAAPNHRAADTQQLVGWRKRLAQVGLVRSPAPNLEAPLLLGTAFAGTIGGMATLIGTPPNAMFAAFARDALQLDFNFLNWLVIGLPVSLLLLVICWWVLVRGFYQLPTTLTPAMQQALLAHRQALGGWRSAERRTGWVFVGMLSLWLLRPLLLGSVAPGFGDVQVALLGALALFLIPAHGQVALPRPWRRDELEDPQPLLTWADARQIPWGILLLFGGGLALARAWQQSGLDREVGALLGGVANLPEPVILLSLALLVALLTELLSNMATISLLLPVLVSAAEAGGVSPLPWMITATLAASCAFMLPVATAPNALVFATGRVSLPEMIRVGFWLSLGGAVLLALLVGVWELFFSLDTLLK